MSAGPAIGGLLYSVRYFNAFLYSVGTNPTKLRFPYVADASQIEKGQIKGVKSVAPRQLLLVNKFY